MLVEIGFKKTTAKRANALRRIKPKAANKNAFGISDS